MDRLQQRRRVALKQAEQGVAQGLVAADQRQQAIAIEDGPVLARIGRGGREPDRRGRSFAPGRHDAAQRGDLLYQLQSIDWLGEELAVSGARAMIAILEIGARGESDYRHGHARVPQHPHRLGAVELRHVQIHEDEVVGASLMQRRHRRLDRLTPVRDHRHLGVDVCQEARHQQLDVRRVVRDQHAQTAPGRDSTGGHDVGLEQVLGQQVLGLVHGQPQHEGRAFVARAAHADLATQHRGQAATDRQAQPRATEAPGRRRVALLKIREDPHHLLG
jgi:hypothetical protein